MLIPMTIDIVTVPVVNTTVLIVRIPTSETETATIIEPVELGSLRSEEKLGEVIGKAVGSVFSTLSGWSGKGNEVRGAITKALVVDQLSQ